MKQLYILGMIVILLLMLWVGSDVLKAIGTVKEGFSANATTSTIQLNFCPSWAPQTQTARGNTDCCEGDLVDGKCTGTTFCTLSPPYDTVPTCVSAWKSYYARKSAQHCPSTMPNYFEDPKNPQAVLGCSASLIQADGTSPRNSTAARCRIYTTEKDNRERTDSCFVEKGRLAVSCPAFAGYSAKVELVTQGTTFGSYVCSYVNSLGQRNSCNDEQSLIAMWDRQDPNWRLNSSKYGQLETLSCRTFLERERQKEAERQRLEAARRQVEEERRKRDQLRSRFTNFFNRFKRSSQSQLDRTKQQITQAMNQKKASDKKVQELQQRLKSCK